MIFVINIRTYYFFIQSHLSKRSQVKWVANFHRECTNSSLKLCISVCLSSMILCVVCLKQIQNSNKETICDIFFSNFELNRDQWTNVCSFKKVKPLIVFRLPRFRCIIIFFLNFFSRLAAFVELACIYWLCCVIFGSFGKIDHRWRVFSISLWLDG